MSNPLETSIPKSIPSQPLQRSTDAVPMRTIHHETLTAIRQATAHVQTREQLDGLLSQVDAIVYVSYLVLVY